MLHTSTYMVYPEEAKPQTGSRMEAARGWEGEIGSYYLMSMEFHSGKIRKFWSWVVVIMNILHYH